VSNALAHVEAAAGSPADQASEPEAVSDARELEMEGLRVENDKLRMLLDRAHDVMVGVMNDIVRTREQIHKAKWRRRYREAGSCITCGAEAYRNQTRCVPCARKNSASTKKRAAAQRQSTDSTGENGHE
jgi:hypothetical protein